MKPEQLRTFQYLRRRLPRQAYWRVSTLELIEYLGLEGHHVMLRYDPERTKKRFTVVVDNLRLGDTDDPKGLLYLEVGKYIALPHMEWAKS